MLLRKIYWGFNMKTKWPLLSLREVNVSLVDCDHRTPPTVDSGYPYVTIPQLKNGRLEITQSRQISCEHYLEWTRKAKPVAYDVVLSRRCNPGETAFVAPDTSFALGQNLVLLHADGSKIYPPFLRWLVRGTEWWEQVNIYRNPGAVFDSLKCKDIPNFKLHIPSFSEQRRIANILSSLDDKIELNRRMNQTLEQMAQMLFRQWFIAFDFPDASGQSYQSIGGKLVKSELGEIPEEWRVGTVGELFNLTMGQSPPGETYNEEGEGLPFYQGRTDFSFRFPIRRIYCSSPTRIAESNDTLVSVRAPVGDLNMAHEKCTIGRGVAAIRHKSNCSSYTYYAMKSLQSKLNAFNGEGTIFGAINKKSFEALTLLEPSASLVLYFEKQTGLLDKLIYNNEIQSRTLATLRDTLLPQLLSGRLTVRQAAELVG